MFKSGHYIGVMSGTSLDGINVVLAEITSNFVKQKGEYFHPIPEKLKHEVLAICQGQQTTLSEIGQIDAELGELFAEAVNGLLAQYTLKPHQIEAIGCHGQTVWHQPQKRRGFSLQIGDNNRVVAETSITTVGDFRRRDMVYGGQGAPLVPAFHRALLSHSAERRVILNMGGIANITVLYPNEMVLGFDTGPANMLMDAWILEKQNKGYDKDAEWAKQGKVSKALFAALHEDPYFSLPAPKSTGREYFNRAWLLQHLLAYPDVKEEDVQRTLLELTARTIVEAIPDSAKCDRLLACGGGSKNPLLMQRLAELLPNSEVALTDAFGISGENMEALAFAWLAARTLSSLPGNVPSVTGASQETILGAIYLKNGK